MTGQLGNLNKDKIMKECFVYEEYAAMLVQ